MYKLQLSSYYQNYYVNDKNLRKLLFLVWIFLLKKY